jgi:hypothetical protein
MSLRSCGLQASAPRWQTGRKKRAGFIICNNPAADGDAAPRSPAGSRRIHKESPGRITEGSEVICRNGLGSIEPRFPTTHERGGYGTA